MNNTHSISVPYITGDGIGQDITPATQLIAETARKKEYGKDATIEWLHMYAGISDIARGGSGLSNEALDLIEQSIFAIKGPMATPVGGGFRSFNVALRKRLDLYACVRPIKYYDYVPTTHIAPWNIDMMIFRENIEDTYSGIEFKAGSADAKKVIETLNGLGAGLSDLAAIGIKNITQYNSERIVKAAAEYAEKYDYDKITLMNKGNIMKETEGGFRKRGYGLIKNNYPNYITQKESRILKDHQEGFTTEEIASHLDREFYHHMTPAQKAEMHEEIKSTIAYLRDEERSWEKKKIVNDMIADNVLQQAFMSPEQFDILVATNLNGDYASDAFAGSIGGLGIAAGANINFETGVAMLEATHGTAGDRPRNVANPLSHTLSFALGCELKGHQGVANRIDKAVRAQIRSGRVTSDFSRTANKIHAAVKAKYKNDREYVGLKYLLKYTKMQKKLYTTLGTKQFAEEIAQRIADQD